MDNGNKNESEGSIDDKRYQLEVKKHDDLIEIERLKVKHDEIRLENEAAELRKKDSKSENSTFKNPLILAILGATIAALGNIYTNHVSAVKEAELERQKAESALISKMLETAGNIQGARENLKFLLDAGLIDNEETKANIESYLEETPEDVGPSLNASNSNSGNIDIEDRSIEQLIALFSGTCLLYTSDAADE